MGKIAEYAKDTTKKGIEVTKDKTPKEGFGELLKITREEFSTAEELTKAKKSRKESVAKRLSQLREEAGYLQKEVSLHIGINVITLSGYEIGKSEPPEEVLVRLANLYGVSLDYLMCRTDTRIEFDEEGYRAIDTDRQQLRERLDSIEQEVGKLRKEVK